MRILNTYIHIDQRREWKGNPERRFVLEVSLFDG